MIIKTKVFSPQGGQRTVYYKHRNADGRVTTGGKRDAAIFDPVTAAKVLAQLKQIDARFAEAELVDD